MNATLGLGNLIERRSMHASKCVKLLFASLLVYFSLAALGIGVGDAQASCLQTFDGGPGGNDSWVCDTPDEAWAKLNEMNPDKEYQCRPKTAYYDRIMRDYKNGFISYWCGSPPTLDYSYGAGNVSSKGNCPVGTSWVSSLKKCATYDPDKHLGCDGDCANFVGNPIDVAVGNKVQVEHDIQVAPLLSFSRTYNSLGGDTRANLGMRWTHTYNRYIVYYDQRTDTGYPEVVVSRQGGRKVTFRYIALKWKADGDIDAKLIKRMDAQGVWVGWTYEPIDAREVEEYDVLGRLIQIRRTDGTHVDLTYNNELVEGNPNDYRLTEVKAQNGRRLAFSYDESGRISKITDPTGAEFGYGYDATSALVAAYYPDGAARIYKYNEHEYTEDTNQPWSLTGIIDENGQRFATYAYGAHGLAVSTEHAGGADKHTVAYNSDGSVTVVGPLGSIRNSAFTNVLGKRKQSVLTESCPGCVSRTSQFTYDAEGGANVTTDARGVTTDSDVSARGLLLQKIEAANDSTGSKRKTVMTWDGAFALPVEQRIYKGTSTLVAKNAWTYNSRGQQLTASRIDPVSAASRTSTWSYCESADVAAGTCPIVGQMIAADGPRTDVNDTTTYTYYPGDSAECAASPNACDHRKGDLWKVTDAAGGVTEFLKYDGAGRALSIKGQNRVVTDFTYHARGWMTARKARGSNDQSETDDAITRVEHWPTGLVRKVIQPDGVYTQYTYDQAHRLTDVADSIGNTIHYTLDAAGGRTVEDTRDGDGVLLRTLSSFYDALGQLQTRKDAYQHATGLTYDANGNADTVTDALNRVTDNDHDPLNRLAKTIQDVGGIGASTQFQYDARDNLTRVIDPKGLMTDYTYNGLNDLTKLTSPDTGVADYTYDSAGNRKTQTDARGVTATYNYDALNRLIGITYPTAALNVTYQYDTVNAVCGTEETFAIGRLSKMTDGSGDTQYCYDRLGDIVRKVQTSNGHSFTLRYTYTLAGRLASITYPSGARVEYVRNALGQPAGVSYTPAGSDTEVLLTSVTYYPFGPAAELEYGDGRHLHRTLNQNYQPGIVEDLGIDGLSLGYEFDAVGNLFKLRKGDQSESPLRKYGYDGLGRLTEVRDGNTEALLQGYGYDATGNRTSVAIGVTTSAYGYQAGNHRLTSVAGQIRGYDAVGNTTSIDGGAREFVYNDAGRLESVKQTGVVVMRYAYNGRGEQLRRFPSEASVQQTYAVYDEAGHTLGVYDSGGVRLQEMIWLDDLPVGVIANDQLLYVEADHLGTPRSVINPVREKAVWRWQLSGEAFGNSSPDQDPDADGTPFVFDLRFPGQFYDASSGLHYNYQRDYDAESGRYIESDPIGLVGGVSTFGYVRGKPAVLADPTGLIDLKIPDVGSVTVHANPGPEATAFRPDHSPAHVHLGSNDGPRVDVNTFKPLSPEDARKMTKEQLKVCSRLTDGQKALIRARQGAVFKYGKYILKAMSMPVVGADSITNACRSDPVACADLIENIGPPSWEK